MRLQIRLILLVLALALLAALLGGPSAAGPGDGAPDPLITQLLAQVDTTTLVGYVADLSGERPVIVGGVPYTFTTRYSYSEGIEKAIQYLYEHYETLGLDVTYHEYLHGGLTWRNVEATLPGVSEPERIYIVCAHADSISQEPMTDAPGADDNASGTAAVMMAADVLSDHQFEYTIRFVNFSGEEQGMLGSAAYAARSRARGEDIAGVINLDMLGWDAVGGPDIDLHAGTDTASLALAQTFSETVALYDLDLLPQIIGQEATEASDHSSFWDNGYAAILAIEDYHPYGHDFNPYYHSDNDLLEHFNLVYFTTFTRAVVATLATLARPVLTPTPTPTSTATLTPTATATPSYTPTPTNTATLTPTLTATPTPSYTPTPTPAATPTSTATFTPTATATPTSTPANEPLYTIVLPYVCIGWGR